jgi:hypothetical protein
MWAIDIATGEDLSVATLHCNRRTHFVLERLLRRFAGVGDDEFCRIVRRSDAFGERLGHLSGTNESDGSHLFDRSFV